MTGVIFGDSSETKPKRDSAMESRPAHRTMTFLQQFCVLTLVVISLTPGCLHTNAGGTAGGGEPEDGIYLVLEESKDREGVEPAGKDTQIVLYDYSFLVEEERQEPKYLKISASPNVPLILKKDPEGVPGEDGRLLLMLELDVGGVVDLERLTRRAIEEKKPVAIVVDGKVASTHGVREVIADGRVQISRCSDDACRQILTHLKERRAP